MNETTRTPNVMSHLARILAGDDKFAQDIAKTASMITGLGAVNEAATLGDAPNLAVPKAIAATEALNKDNEWSRSKV